MGSICSKVSTSPSKKVQVAKKTDNHHDKGDEKSLAHQVISTYRETKWVRKMNKIEDEVKTGFAKQFPNSQGIQTLKQGSTSSQLVKADQLSFQKSDVDSDCGWEDIGGGGNICHTLSDGHVSKQQ